MRWKSLILLPAILLFGGVLSSFFQDYFQAEGDSATKDSPYPALSEPSLRGGNLPEEKGPAESAQEIKGTDPVVPPAVPEKIAGRSFIAGVPFTAQAPSGQWGDPIFQNGCEEASLVMAAYWISGKPLTPALAEREMRSLAAYEEEWLGHSVDTSIEDTRILFEKQYGIAARAEHTDDTTLAVIREALAAGAIVIVPADGRKLRNPYFRPPGPVRHMLVIIGYDAAKKEFITHDPGTKRGADYRYGEETLFEAIREYPTGDHLPFGAEHKTILIVEKP